MNVLQVADEIEILKEKRTALDDEYAKLLEEFQPLKNLRSAGEGVVLDLLQAAEVYTMEQGNPQVYVTTGSTKEKPNTQGILSEVKIDWQKIESERKRILEIQSEIRKVEGQLNDPRLNSFAFTELRKELAALVEEQEGHREISRRPHGEVFSLH